MTIERDRVPEFVRRTHRAEFGRVAHVLLYGPPGTGKTSLAATCARIHPDGTAQTVRQHTFRSDESDAGAFGMQVPDGSGGIGYQAGPVLLSMLDGGLLVANEINKAGPDVLDRLYFALDDESVAEETLPDGTAVRAHPEYRVIATMNGTPDELPEAVQDRFALKIAVTMPSSAQLALLPDDVRAACQLAYEKAPDPITGPAITFRMWRTYADLRSTLGGASDLLAAELVTGSHEAAVALTEAVTMALQAIRERWTTMLRRLVDGVVYAAENTQPELSGDEIVTNLFRGIAIAARAALRQLLEEGEQDG